VLALIVVVDAAAVAYTENEDPIAVADEDHSPVTHPKPELVALVGPDLGQGS
jgi:hypothetical protein